MPKQHEPYIEKQKTSKRYLIMIIDIPKGRFNKNHLKNMLHLQPDKHAIIP